MHCYFTATQNTHTYTPSTLSAIDHFVLLCSSVKEEEEEDEYEEEEEEAKIQ